MFIEIKLPSRPSVDPERAGFVIKILIFNAGSQKCAFRVDPLQKNACNAGSDVNVFKRMFMKIKLPSRPSVESELLGFFIQIMISSAAS